MHLTEEHRQALAAVVAHATRPENRYRVDKDPDPKDHPASGCQLGDLRVVFTLAEREPERDVWRHLRVFVETPGTLPDSELLWTICSLCGFTGATVQDGVALAPGPGWIVGMHHDRRSLLVVEPLSPTCGGEDRPVLPVRVPGGYDHQAQAQLAYEIWDAVERAAAMPARRASADAAPPAADPPMTAGLRLRVYLPTVASQERAALVVRREAALAGRDGRGALSIWFHGPPETDGALRATVRAWLTACGFSCEGGDAGAAGWDLAVPCTDTEADMLAILCGGEEFTALRARGVTAGLRTKEGM